MTIYDKASTDKLVKSLSIAIMALEYLKTDNIPAEMTSQQFAEAMLKKTISNLENKDQS